ncbi:hypothetical protein M422DRAFT_250009 [Sphaerobolus stellatus SS14]|nr:hypothetical protein M422DRAFT_250009 [Sphaerobolus stellatus SS14]
MFRSFGFLQSQHFILAYSRLDGEAQTTSLKVYNFSKPINTKSEPTLYHTFQLPSLKRGVLLSEVAIICCPFSETDIKSMPSGLPFYTSPSSWIVGVSIGVFDGFRNYGLMMLFFPSTLLNDAAYPLRQEDVPWESWGPKGTRIVEVEVNALNSIRYTHGTRFATIRKSEGHIYVYDFNPATAHRKLESTHANPDDFVENDIERILQNFTREDVNLFVKPVKTFYHSASEKVKRNMRTSPW